MYRCHSTPTCDTLRTVLQLIKVCGKGVEVAGRGKLPHLELDVVQVMERRSAVRIKYSMCSVKQLPARREAPTVGCWEVPQVPALLVPKDDSARCAYPLMGLTRRMSSQDLCRCACRERGVLQAERMCWRCFGSCRRMWHDQACNQHSTSSRTTRRATATATTCMMKRCRAIHLARLLLRWHHGFCSSTVL